MAGYGLNGLERPEETTATNWTNGGHRGKLREVTSDVGWSYPDSITRAALRIKLREFTGKEDDEGREIRPELSVTFSLKDVRHLHEVIESFLRLAECPTKLMHDGRCNGLAVLAYQKDRECVHCRAAADAVALRWDGAKRLISLMTGGAPAK